MSRRKQRRALVDLAATLREIADDIHTIGAPGGLKLRGPDRVEVAESAIAAGVTLFDVAAEILLSGKPSPETLTAATALSTTAEAWRATN